MRLYLDTSVLNRPFDDQKQPRIWLETLAFSLVLSLIEAREAELISSPIHTLENSRSPLPVRANSRAPARNRSTPCTSPVPRLPEPTAS